MDHRLTIQGSSAPAFTMTLELERIAANYASGIPRLSVSAIIQRGQMWDAKDIASAFPVILSLHGALTSATAYDSLGATLQPPDDLPFALPTSDVGALNLTFVMTDRFVQFLEEERQTKQGALDMRLALHLTGVVALMVPDASQQAAQPTWRAIQPNGNIVGLRRLSSDTNADALRIPRSDWLDRLLPGLGYERSVLVELPLTRTPPVPEEYKQAVAALDSARKAFEREDYRASLKYGRDVLEHIGKLASDGKLSTFCREQLEPVIGKTKSGAIDGAMNVLRDVVSASSHANAFSADRAIAAYVIETLAVQFRYVSAVVAL